MSTILLSTVKKLVETKNPRTIGKNFAGPSMEKTKELSNLLVVFKTYFSNLLTTNLANIFKPQEWKKIEIFNPGDEMLKLKDLN